MKDKSILVEYTGLEAMRTMKEIRGTCEVCEQTGLVGKKYKHYQEEHPEFAFVVTTDGTLKCTCGKAVKNLRGLVGHYEKVHFPENKSLNIPIPQPVPGFVLPDKKKTSFIDRLAGALRFPPKARRTTLSAWLTELEEQEDELGRQKDIILTLVDM